MTEIPSYSHQNPNHLEPLKPKKQYISSSFITIFLSILTYILIFYIPEISFSSIFNNTKVLFFISNALIIIIAADYGAFTDKENHDLYEEFKAKMKSTTSDHNLVTENMSYTEISTEEIQKREEQESTKDISCILLHEKEEFPEKIIQVTSEIQPRDITTEKHETKTDENDHKTVDTRVTCNARNKGINPKPYGRSKSDKARGSEKHRVKSYDRRKSDSSKWMVVPAEEWENVREESEEFSKMSNEELNRRVEEFIQKFNGEMKRELQVGSN